MNREEEIRMIAYALWAREGYGHTSAVRRWLQAEAIWEQDHKAMETEETSQKDGSELRKLTTAGSGNR